MIARDLSPTAHDLRLGDCTGRSLDEELEAVIGDPAYVHEFSNIVRPHSRKQMELALRRLVQAGRIIRLGHKNRRIYTSKRPLHPALEDLPSEAIRLLQLMPIEGAVIQSSFERHTQGDSGLYSQIASKHRALAEAGLLIVARSAPRVLMLSELGRAARANLGTGLMWPAESPAVILSTLDCGQARHLRTLRDGPRAPDAGLLKLLERYIKKGLITKNGSSCQLTDAGRVQDACTAAVEAEMCRLQGSP